MLYEAGMLDTACKSDLIVNGRVNNQSSAASLITHEHYPDCSASLPFSFPLPTLLLAQHSLQRQTVRPPAISVFIHLLITGVYQSSFQVSVKTCNPSVTQPPVLRWHHRNEDDLSKTQQWVQGSTMDTVEHPLVFSETLSPQSRWYIASNIFKNICHSFKTLHPGIPLWLWELERCLTSGT